MARDRHIRWRSRLFSSPHPRWAHLVGFAKPQDSSPGTRLVSLHTLVAGFALGLQGRLHTARKVPGFGEVAVVKRHAVVVLQGAY